MVTVLFNAIIPLMMRQPRLLLVFLWLIFFSAIFVPSLRADALKLKDGRTINVKILSEDEQYVTFEEGGIRVKKAKAEIYMVVRDEVEAPAEERKAVASIGALSSVGSAAERAEEREPLGLYTPASVGPGGLTIMEELALDLSKEPVKAVEKNGERIYKDKTPEAGPFEMYHRDGRLKATMSYLDRVPHGPFRLYYWDGKLKERGMFEKGAPDGAYRTYYSSGKLREKGALRGGAAAGEYKLYYENGKVKEEGFSKSGKAEGECKVYYESGQLKEKGSFTQGRPEGPVERYYESGVLQGEWFIKDRMFDGAMKLYYENGKLAVEEIFKNGISEGPIRLNDTNEQPIYIKKKQKFRPESLSPVTGD